MIGKNGTRRRAFVAKALAVLAAIPTFNMEASQAPEVPTYYGDVPPGATLWGLVVFTADEPVEMILSAGKSIKSLKGQFGGQRLIEYSWRNNSKSLERVGIRARALAGDRELPAVKAEFLSERNLHVGFGRRGTPEKLADRKGGYPYEAVFLGFIVFGD
jgi:hypothetical protein